MTLFRTKSARLYIPNIQSTLLPLATTETIMLIDKKDTDLVRYDITSSSNRNDP